MSNTQENTLDTTEIDDSDFDYDLGDTAPVPILAVPARDLEAANDDDTGTTTPIAAQLERLVEATETINANLERIAEVLASKGTTTRKRARKTKKTIRKKA